MLSDEVIQTKTDEIALDKGYTYRPELGERVCQFIESYCVINRWPHVGPLKLLDWQRNLVMRAYSWVRPPEIQRCEDERRFNSITCFLPKKNGKSTLIGAILLAQVLEYPGSECYCIATDVAQARIVFRSASMFAIGHPELDKVFWVRDNISTIVDQSKEGGGSFIRVLSSSPENKSGWDANLVVWDEMCSLGAHAPQIWEELGQATAAKPNSMRWVITHPQNRANSLDHIGYERYRYAKGVLTGDIPDLHELPVIYEVPLDADWHDEAQWALANPSLGVSLSIAELREQYAKALRDTRTESEFRCKRLGQWISSSAALIPDLEWQACSTDYSEIDLADNDCAYIGVDMAKSFDCCAIVTVIKKDDLWYIVPRIWIPESKAREWEDQLGLTLSQWHEEGHLLYSPGATHEAPIIEAQIRADIEAFNVSRVFYDPKMFDHIRQSLEQDGITCEAVKQTPANLAPATDYLIKLAKDKKLRHNNNPAYNWHLHECELVTKQDGNSSINKAYGKSRIDAIDATICALYGYLQEQEAIAIGPQAFSLSRLRRNR